jgi:TetR/AcrR family tetracycline transcriptional repressor
LTAPDPAQGKISFSITSSQFTPPAGADGLLNNVQERRTMGFMDAQIITNAALDVLDEVGLDKLSMRLVAARLGVQAGGLYYYVADKAALLRAMADELCQQVLSQAGSGRPAGGDGRPAGGDGRPGVPEQTAWAGEAAELCRVLRSVLNRHRDSARVLAASPLQGSLNALELMERLIAGLEDGVPLELTGAAADTLMAYVTGFVLQEQIGAPQQFPLTVPELAARFPRVLRAAGSDDDEMFATAVATIIAGFSDRAPRSR